MTKEEKQKIINSAIEYYKNSKETVKSVSQKFKIGQETLSKYLKINNVEIRKPIVKSSKSDKLNTISQELKDRQGKLTKSQFKQLLIDLAIKEYQESSIYERSISKLANKYGLNRKTIAKYLNIKGIEITNTHGKIPFNEDAFDSIDTEEKAYWLGFLYADGFITSKGYQVGLTLSIKDSEHLKKYNCFLNYSKGMNIWNSHQFGSKEKFNKNGELMQVINTTITNQHLWESLNSKGCVPNKSLILKFPDLDIFKSKNLVIPFIRGYFDGDGTLGVYPHSKTNPNLEASLMFVGTKPFLEGIQENLGIQGFLMQKPNCGPLTYRLSYSTKKAVNVATLLYDKATIYLDRKYNIYTTKYAALKSGKNGEA